VSGLIKKLFVFFCLLLLSGITGCVVNQQASAPQTPKGKIIVTATIYPYYEFACRVGGERAQVKKLIPAGGEPHSWEPSPRDMVSVFDGQVFIFNGAGMEPWVGKQKEQLAQKKVQTVEASAGMDLIRHEEGAHEHHAVDPHVWLDPVYAQQIVNKIKNALCEVDPVGKNYYSERAAAYCEELDQLDREYREGLGDYANREIVVSHEAFGYLARRYGLQQVGIMGLSPESEPDPAHLKEVVKFCREHKVRYIFFEALVSPKLSETVARETGARPLALNPIGNLTPEQQARGDNYLSLMRENLANLKMALEGEK
jgi:zinc transport system substrate-binding protein